MPRAFLVKKINIAAGKRNWSELPDSARGDIYVPVSSFPPYVDEVSEGSLAEYSCCEKARSAQKSKSAQLPSSAAQVQDDQGPESKAMKKNLLYSHSTIEVTIEMAPCQAVNLENGSKLNFPSAISVFSCKECDKTFNTARLLKRHGKCHSETKRYSCEYCGKGFNDTFDLKRHVRTHTGVRPYKCTLCVKAFTQLCSLESHLRKIHAISQQYAFKERRDKLYVCEKCGLTAKTRDSLQIHLQVEHAQSSRSTESNYKLTVQEGGESLSSPETSKTKIDSE